MVIREGLKEKGVDLQQPWREFRVAEKTVASVKIWPQGDPLGGFLGLLGLVVPGVPSLSYHVFV